jgi:hypothetical protein
MYAIQKQISATPSLLWEHKQRDRIGLDFYVAFPSMHEALPVIAM